MLFAIALRTTIVCATSAGSEGAINKRHVAEDAKPDFTMMLGIPSFMNGETLMLQLDELFLNHRSSCAHFNVRVATFVDTCLDAIHGTVDSPSLQTIAFSVRPLDHWFDDA